MSQFPDDETGATLYQFQQHGFDLSKPLEMDFFVAVPSEGKGNLVALQADKLGFNTCVEQDEETKEWTCYCTMTLVPKYSEVVKIEEQLTKIAKPYGGYADGFGSYGNA
ncbi:ribonuclease E inhibitor RraB [Vibrio sp. HN007]|uniref:ribonuclease E inhibitor RraB n=1 Tax=Vibrio iocasae TaxID=3098914 RepID=UPI0035D50DB7